MSKRTNTNIESKVTPITITDELHRTATLDNQSEEEIALGHLEKKTTPNTSKRSTENKTSIPNQPARVSPLKQAHSKTSQTLEPPIESSEVALLRDKLKELGKKKEDIEEEIKQTKKALNDALKSEKVIVLDFPINPDEIKGNSKEFDGLEFSKSDKEKIIVQIKEIYPQEISPETLNKIRSGEFTFRFRKKTQCGNERCKKGCNEEIPIPSHGPYTEIFVDDNKLGRISKSLQIKLNTKQ